MPRFSPPPLEPNAPGETERYVIPNLRNACRILKLMGASRQAWKGADLARALQIPVTTTLRIMTTLVLEGLVRKTNGRFELGPVLIQLGHAALAGTEIRELALPILAQLSKDADETAHVAIPCDDRSLILAVHDSAHPLRAASRPGYLAELHCSSTGKVFLTWLHADRLEEVVEPKNLLRRTPKSLTTFAALRKEIEATRQRGYSLDDEEYHPGVRCTAAPIFASDGSVVAAIGITASAARFTTQRVGELSNLVRLAAAELSRKLGYVV